MDKGQVRIPKPDGWKPEPTYPEEHRWHGHPRCMAWNSKHGRQCGKIAYKVMAGGHPQAPETHSTMCERDGGKSLRGEAHPNYQGKGYSRFVPTELGPQVEEFLRQEDPLSLLQSISTWEGRADQLLRTLEEAGDPGQLFKDIRKVWGQLWAAMDADRFDTAMRYRNSIEAMLDQGSAVSKTWDGVQAADDMKRKLIDSEDKRRERQRGYVTAEQLRFRDIAIRQAVIESMDLIEDKELQTEVRRFIAKRFIQVLGIQALPGHSAGN